MKYDQNGYYFFNGDYWSGWLYGVAYNEDSFKENSKDDVKATPDDWLDTWEWIQKTTKRSNTNE